MKLNKRILKDIVKECLVEILAEGLVSGTGDGASKRSSLNESIKKTGSSLSSRKSRSNKQGSVESNDFQRRSSHNEVKTETPLKNIKISNDPIMNEIFADTAATTLREQSESRHGRPHIPKTDTAARLVDESPLDELFGNASQKWEALAFAPSITNK